LLPPSQLRIRSRGARKKAPKPRTETEAFLFTPHSLLNKDRPRALGRSAGSFPVVLFPNEKDARKRYAQRAEDPLRLYVVSVGNCTIFSPIV
ncbi:hypothetical protein LINPERPRIM_LOCUS38251, partial [Linum perenne]